MLSKHKVSPPLKKIHFSGLFKMAKTFEWYWAFKWIQRMSYSYSWKFQHFQEKYCLNFIDNIKESIRKKIIKPLSSYILSILVQGDLYVVQRFFKLSATLPFSSPNSKKGFTSLTELVLSLRTEVFWNTPTNKSGFPPTGE